jgi:hypothetical protein
VSTNDERSSENEVSDNVAQPDAARPVTPTFVFRASEDRRHYYVLLPRSAEVK